MISHRLVGHLSALLLSAAGCNSDLPVSATTEVESAGFRVTITRVATHPFLARYNLKMTVNTTAGCSAVSELFPDTGWVSRRNLYLGNSGKLFIVGQFDVRRFDARSCRIELIEFRSLETGMTFVGSFDIGATGEWTFLPVAVRAERAFEKL